MALVILFHQKEIIGSVFHGKRPILSLNKRNFILRNSFLKRSFENIKIKLIFIKNSKCYQEMKKMHFAESQERKLCVWAIKERIFCFLLC
ncbi:hypothetical protein [Enterococcus sp. LJL90]